jgi:hypothetical protein
MDPQVESPVWMNAVAAVIFFGGLIVFVYFRHVRKLNSFEGFAGRRGMRFYEFGTPGMAPLDGTMLAGMAEKAFDVGFTVEGKIDGLNATIFEAYFSLHDGPRSKMYHYPVTVIELQSKDLDLPKFTARPETLFQKAAALAGGQDINISAQREFSKRYRLMGEDEAALRKLFDGPAAKHLVEHGGLIVEGHGDRVIFWKPRKLLKPKALDKALEDAVGFVGCLRG